MHFERQRFMRLGRKQWGYKTLEKVSRFVYFLIRNSLVWYYRHQHKRGMKEWDAETLKGNPGKCDQVLSLLNAYQRESKDDKSESSQALTRENLMDVIAWIEASGIYCVNQQKSTQSWRKQSIYRPSFWHGSSGYESTNLRVFK